MAGQESAEDVIQEIARGLRRGLEMGNRAVQHNIAKKQTLRIKFEYNGERRQVLLHRPVTYEQLVAKVEELFNCRLNISFTQANGEIFGQITNQGSLDSAVQVVDKNDKISSLRLLLTNSSSPPFNHRITTSKSHHTRDSPSPPPGSLPEHDRSYNHSVSTSSITSDGEFIPEKDSLLSDSNNSLDSCYASAHGDRGETFPRGRRDTRRSILSDGPPEEYDRMDQRFGTYPRNSYPFHAAASNSESHRTYPRMTMNAKVRTDTQTISLRSLASRGSEGTLSTSSSSSGFPPEPEDSPEGRLFKRSSQDGSPLYNPAYSKSPQCPRNWRKGNRLGCGAFGEVYLCFDHDTGRELACKVVKLVTVNAEVSKEVRALENEINLLRNFAHERIVQYYGCSSEGQDMTIFMEYMAGGSVFDVINKYGALTEPVTGRYTRQILEGLAYLHKNSIVHRDVKGANILRDNSGNIKLADFGTSKRLKTIVTCSGMQEKNTVVGTPYWMAPEVINGETYGRKADLWSVGCTVVEMLTKKPPWPELETMAAIYKIATADFPKYRLPDSTTDYVHDFLKLVFKRDSRQRPTAEDLLLHPMVNR
ncbi:mitogen-activated protein kinase kinase kinase 2-like [Mya arenaria]|uniref:mitogen-activated protein kinase kinase kinase 2-like n=1 Tax=Mya arenaria TaxID=6604 RepID=UPI0022E7E3F2|nr:mitogen-activated protein kinase kinase kinase 2-like [Mya arenaria]